MLHNAEETLHHGWFAVKQRDTEQLKLEMDWDQVRELEMRFFQATAPWSGLVSQVNRRLGTQRLVQKVSEVLSNLIKKRCVDSMSGVIFSQG